MKERLDVLLVKNHLAPSREKAKAVIMAGDVFVNGVREDKPGVSFDEDCEITVRAEPEPYVSRGGRKLERALRNFDLSVSGAVCMDIGSSTGGFTDCMLQNGAAKVYAVDVGYGQLSWRLRQDPRVVCMEKTNIRYVTPQDIPEPIDFASADVSFISLTKILLPVRALLKEDGSMVCLIKPQFEAGREKVGRHGVVRDASVHEEVITTLLAFCGENGFWVRDLDFSPIKGPSGNIEYLMHLQKTNEVPDHTPLSVKNVVSAAHRELS